MKEIFMSTLILFTGYLLIGWALNNNDNLFQIIGMFFVCLTIGIVRFAKKKKREDK